MHFETLESISQSSPAILCDCGEKLGLKKAEPTSFYVLGKFYSEAKTRTAGMQEFLLHIESFQETAIGAASFARMKFSRLGNFPYHTNDVASFLYYILDSSL